MHNQSVSRVAQGRKGRCRGGPVPPDPCPSPLQLGRWLDGEGAARLQEMGAEEWSPDSFEKSFERFNEFLRQATVRWEGNFHGTYREHRYQQRWCLARALCLALG